MKNLRLCVAWLALLMVPSPSAFSQAFTNLDFGSAVTVPTSPGFIQFGPAYPSWSAFYDASPLSPETPITFNLMRAGTSGLGLQGTSPNFLALLQGGTGPNEPAVSLAQTGFIPEDSLSLHFMANTFRLANGIQQTFTLSVNGQPLPYAQLENSGGFRVFAADISPFAGQTVELRFTQPSGQAVFDDLYLDNISFSPNPVPEPSTWALLTLGSALFWCAARRRRK